MKSYTPSQIRRAKAELELRERRRAREEKEEAQKEIWRDYPDVYAAERLNLALTMEQILILYSVKNNRRTAVKAHHSLGKTFVAAILLLWWIDCWKAHIGYVTAPTWGQALGLTFKQAKRLAIINKLDFQILNSGIIRDWDDFRATERFIKALNAESGEGFQGEHTAPILIVIEEAVGVANYIFEATEGLMTHPDCRELEIGNPTDEATIFGEHCELSTYEVFSFSALDHPNIVAELRSEPPPFPGAVRLLWLYEQLDKECDVVDSMIDDCFAFYTVDVVKAALHGTPAPEIQRDEKNEIILEESGMCIYKPTAFFQGRVLGDFPTEASNKVIPPGWVKFLPEKQVNPRHKIQLGCDVARFGDDRTTIFARIGAVALLAREIRKFDTIAIVSAIKDVLREVCKMLGLPEEYAKSIHVNIDVTGGLGTGPYDMLKNEGYNVHGINSSEKAYDSELYKNRRSELWFQTRDRAKEKNLDFSRLAPDLRRRLIKELGTPLYKVRGGKKVVEEKDETKKRLGASPDLADGLNLAYYEPIILEETPPPGSFSFGI